MESRLDVYADGLACHGLIKLLVNVFVNPKPTLFQELSVHEMIWGYTDPMLKRIYEDHGLPIVKNCPIPADLTPLVQLQVSSVVNVTCVQGGVYIFHFVRPHPVHTESLYSFT